MNADKLELLREELDGLIKSADHLEYSLQRCHSLSAKSSWNLEELERLESLTSRFARLADLLTHRLMRLIDELELTSDGSLLDRFQRMEKRELANARDLVRIRELRNLIAHEYSNDRMAEIFQASAALGPGLIDVVKRTVNYADGLLARYADLT